ncbi:MAG: SRPBCC domain-containing protein, partial [Candidatus Dormibacteria bacterium]
MTTTTETSVTTQVYRVYIRATAQAVWDAITRLEWTERYGYGGRVEYDLRPGGAYRALTNDGMRSMGAPD